MTDSILFDFDGVILDSVNIKTEAFGRLFEGEAPGAQEKIVAYHLANAGISRYKKFEYIYPAILKKALEEAERERLGKRFHDLVFEAVLQADWIPGAKEFLEKWSQRLPLWVVSGTPQDELREIVRLRGIKDHFRGVYGSPDTKPVIIRRILQENGWEPCRSLFVGDAVSDWEAARETGLAFIGVRGAGEDPFDSEVRKIKSLLELEGVIQ